MASTLLPFLYQTRTLRAATKIPIILHTVRFAHYSRRTSRVENNAIPFEWNSEGMEDGLTENPEQVSTITPSEAEVFKGIFDEIAQGRMPLARKRRSASQSEADEENPSASDSGRAKSSRSIVEQARVTEFRETFLKRYPSSLRDAAQVALGLYEFELGATTLGGIKVMEMNEDDSFRWKERSRYASEKADELERVERLMADCNTDDALWSVLEKEVFSLPGKLGILQTGKKPQSTSKGGRKKKQKASEKSALERDGQDEKLKSQGNKEEMSATSDTKYIMDIHGPLYSQFINKALKLFDTGYKRPSPYAFQILPRIKELGLPSYVLGVSTPFYTRLAKMYWTRFGDANSALDVLQELNSVGLYADEDVKNLLVTIRDNLHGCTWGAQGPFVMAMVDSAPYDRTLIQRLDYMDKVVKRSLFERARDYAPSS